MRYFVSILLTNLISFSAYAVCEIPTADEGGGSPAAIVGKIGRIDNSKNIFELKVSGKTFEVNVSSKKIFTQFGGTILLKEMKIGDKVELWTRGCEVPKSNNITPEFIRIYK